MLGHFLFFIRTETRNRLVRFGKRLRSPKYAVAILVGIAYFFFAFGGPAMFGQHRPTSPAGANGWSIVLPLMLMLQVGWWWLGGGSPNALAMKPAEVNLLIPAPITRTQLLQFKLLRGQIPILMSAVIFALFVGRRTPAPFYLRFPALWLLFSNLHLHQIAAALVHASARQHGSAGWRKNRFAVLVFMVCMGGLIGTAMAAPDSNILMKLRAAFDAAPGSWVVAPFRVVMEPAMAQTFSQWLLPFAIGLVLLAAHYIWVIRADVAFEESAAEAGAKVAATVEAMRAGKRVSWRGDVVTRKKLPKPWFPLRPEGKPAVAILWKNVLYTTRSFSWFIPIAALGFPFVIGIIGYTETHSIKEALQLSAVPLAAFAFMVFMFGPLSSRNDFRSDLANIELLRTLPVPSTHMVAAQMGASTVNLVLLEALLIIPAAILLALSGDVPALPALGGALAILLVLPALNALAVGIQNGFALAFPAWSRIGANQVGGVERMGQQILTVLGAALLLVIGIIPALIIGAAVGAGALPTWGAGAIIPAVLGAIATLYGEVALLVQFLAGVYDRLDPADAGLIR